MKKLGCLWLILSIVASASAQEIDNPSDLQSPTKNKEFQVSASFARFPGLRLNFDD
jgi:hypothetical protein